MLLHPLRTQCLICVQLCTESHKCLHISYRTARFTLYERADILTFLHNIILYVELSCSYFRWANKLLLIKNGDTTQHDVYFTLMSFLSSNVKTSKSYEENSVTKLFHRGWGVEKFKEFINENVPFAFSALTLLVGHQEEHQASKKFEWWGAGVVICLQQGANDLHIVQLMKLPPHHLLLHQNPEWFNLSGAGFPMLSWKKGR